MASRDELDELNQLVSDAVEAFFTLEQREPGQVARVEHPFGGEDVTFEYDQSSRGEDMQAARSALSAIEDHVDGMNMNNVELDSQGQGQGN